MSHSTETSQNETATCESSPAPAGDSGVLLSLTERAVAKVKAFAETMDGAKGKPLRIFVQGGGCSGFQYGFTFDDPQETDFAFETSGVQVLVDPQSATYLRAATVDFVEDFRGSGFTVLNPNSSGSCGCGKSFSA